MIEEKMPSDPQKDPIITSIMSLMLPGLGQLMKGHTIQGIFWALVVGFSYLVFLNLGIIIHSLCILDAAFNHRGDKIPRKWVAKGLLLFVVIFLVYYVSYRNSAF